MTKEALLERRKKLKINFENAVAQANALEGAIMECDYWIKEAEAKEKAEASDKKAEQKDRKPPAQK